jgi:hypothetical protein
MTVNTPLCSGKHGCDCRQDALVERLELRPEAAVMDLLADRPGEGPELLQPAMQPGQ